MINVTIVMSTTGFLHLAAKMLILGTGGAGLNGNSHTHWFFFCLFFLNILNISIINYRDQDKKPFPCKLLQHHNYPNLVAL